MRYGARGWPKKWPLGERLRRIPGPRCGDCAPGQLGGDRAGVWQWLIYPGGWCQVLCTVGAVGETGHGSGLQVAEVWYALLNSSS